MKAKWWFILSATNHISAVEQSVGDTYQAHMKRSNQGTLMAIEIIKSVEDWEYRLEPQAIIVERCLTSKSVAPPSLIHQIGWRAHR